MIAPGKLAKLSPRHRMRKIALVLGEVERALLGQRGGAHDAALYRYALELAKLILSEMAQTQALRAAALALSALGPDPSDEESLRAIDTLRHALLRETGQAPADWDLLDPSTGLPDSASRTVYPGRKVFLEDIRSPFNVGSIFRTADAFGVEEIVLSPSCADPLHPRAERSAMGSVSLIAWRRAELESLGTELPIFALELGGQPIESFSFPDKGIVILGSEELGISRAARSSSGYGIVSIPMAGAKASLNVAVAFGILMQAWNSSIRAPRGT